MSPIAARGVGSGQTGALRANTRHGSAKDEEAEQRDDRPSVAGRHGDMLTSRSGPVVLAGIGESGGGGLGKAQPCGDFDEFGVRYSSAKATSVTSWLGHDCLEVDWSDGGLGGQVVRRSGRRCNEAQPIRR